MKTSSIRRTTALAAASLVIIPLLSACAVIAGPTPDTPPRTAPAAPEVAPEFFPDGTAEENMPYFTETLRTFVSGEEEVRGVPLTNAVSDAGFAKRDMQVSYDESKTGLVADNIFVSVLIGSECMIGQVVTADRTFVVDQVAAVGPAQDVCLIGETRPISW